MILEFFINILFGFFDFVFAALPEIEWTVDTSAWQYVGDILSMVAYLLPMKAIGAVITLIVDIALIRIGIAFIRTIYGFIPFI